MGETETDRPPLPLAFESMKLIIRPWIMGVSAARHLAWYVNYQMTGEARPSR